MILWTPEATKKLYGPKGKPFIGGTYKKKLILHTTEITTRLPNYTAPPHLTAEILEHDMVANGLWQHIPYDKAAYSLRENALEDDYWTWQVEMNAKAKDIPNYPEYVYENIAWVVNWFVENLGVKAVFADFSVMQYGMHAPQRMTDEAVRQFEGIMGHAHFGLDVDEHWDPGRLHVPKVQKYMVTAPPPPPPPPDEEEEMNTLKLGDEGNLVLFYQAAFNGWIDEYNLGNDKKVELNKTFDEDFEDAVKFYQKAAQVEENGAIDGALAPALARFHPWFQGLKAGGFDEVAREQADAAHTRLDGLHAI